MPSPPTSLGRMRDQLEEGGTRPHMLGSRRRRIGELLTAEESAVAVVPVSLAERHNVLPLRHDPDGALVLAVADPTDVVAIEDVRLATGTRTLRLVVAPSSVIARGREQAYSLDQRAGQLLEQL